MNISKIQNLKVLGNTVCSGGQYNKITVLGELKARSAMSAETIFILGYLEVFGQLTAGVLDIKGKATTKSLVVNQISNVLGELRVSDGIKANQLDIKGSMISRGIVEAGSLKVYGTFRGEQMMKVDNLYIHSWKSSIGTDISGKSILVKKAGVLGSFVLKAQRLSFDTVEIDYTEAEMVKGKSIYIGEHCRIGTVEYSEQLFAHPMARIGKVVKTEAEYPVNDTSKEVMF